MKGDIKRLDYISVLKYLTIFFFFIIFNKAETTVMPYSIAVLGASLAEGCSIVTTPVLFILSFLVLGETGLILSVAISAIILAIITFIYKKFNTSIKYELSAYTLVALIGFLLIGNTQSQIPIDKRIFTTITCVGLCFLSTIAGKAISKKGLKFKLGFEEWISIALLTAVSGVGICNFISPVVWKTISVLIILIVCYVYRTGIATIISAVLGISLSIYYNDINFISVLLLLAVISECTLPLSRHVSGIALLAGDFLIETLFNVYGGYTLYEFIPTLIGVVLFSIIPTKFLAELKEKLYSFREKQLVRQAINRNRIALSGRLYDLSGVFSEMSSALTLFNQKQPSEDSAKKGMIKTLFSSVCENCEHHKRCSQYGDSRKIGATKLIDIGFAKGRLSLIDIPPELNNICFHPNNVLFCLNKLLADYRSIMLDKMNVQNGRELLSMEASGISEILGGMALDVGTLIKYHTRLERALFKELNKKGFLIDELLIFGEEEKISVSLIVVMKEFSVDGITRVVSKVLRTDMTIKDKSQISDDKCFLSLIKSPTYDAVFGLAKAIKDNSEQSGDTHAVARLNENRFLLALSDGMGSGKVACEISSAALSLIESFYKAGLKSELILSTVNKLLAVNTEDSFTALDVGVINFTDCTADFIKYGSPYGFIVGKGGIRIIEGSSLPLGILDELKPSVCKTQLENGDMIILITDGISESFGSSSTMIDFLREIPAKNPQTLADTILNKAVELTGGKKNDDMTVLAVRVYKKKPLFVA